MKFLTLILLSFGFLYLGYSEVSKTRNTIACLEEIIKLIGVFKNEISLHGADYYTLLETAKKENFKFIIINNEKINFSKNSLDFNYLAFFDFLNQIGKTDIDNQLKLCDENLLRFKECLRIKKNNEKSKVQISTALSVLSAISVVVLFI